MRSKPWLSFLGTKGPIGGHAPAGSPLSESKPAFSPSDSDGEPARVGGHLKWNPHDRVIRDRFHTLKEVQEELRRNGLESSQLIVGFDFTKSNEWTGRYSFGNRCLHDTQMSNPYEVAASIIARTLAPFDDDNLIPSFGFGDTTTHDRKVFSFFQSEAPAKGLKQVVQRYRQIAPRVCLSGPTSFAPLIHQAMRTTIESGMQYHICIIIADGQVTRSPNTSPGRYGPQEQATVDAIVAASKLPLSIIMVGVGDGPFHLMQEFDDALPARKFDNFQFVNFTHVMAETRHDSDALREALFALNALMEIPDQYKEIVEAGLLGASVPHGLPDNVHQAPLDPPASVDFVPKSSGEYQNGHLLSWDIMGGCSTGMRTMDNDASTGSPLPEQSTAVEGNGGFSWHDSWPPQLERPHSSCSASQQLLSHSRLGGRNSLLQEIVRGNSRDMSSRGVVHPGSPGSPMGRSPMMGCPDDFLRRKHDSLPQRVNRC